ncbi:MAG: PspC domain-containing protein [Bacteroidaceae bacterium]|nr:PspC domain-containing protein [Bacteroidaceae bacterium]
MSEAKKLYRSKTDKKIFGVCGGFAEYFDIDVTIIRIIFLVLLLCVGSGLLAYLICALIMPEQK